MRALQDHADRRHIPATATETRHVGFYRLKYKEVWEARPDVTAVGGRVLSGKNGKIIGGRMTAAGTVFMKDCRRDSADICTARSCPRMRKRWIFAVSVSDPNAGKCLKNRGSSVYRDSETTERAADI